MSTARDVLSRVKISAIYTRLTGSEPRRSGPDRSRGPATWRRGDGFSVAMDDAKGVWHDFVSGDGGGVLDLIIRARGGNRADALRWVAEFAGVRIDEGALSPAERERWVQQNRQLERELPSARYWQRAAMAMSEELLRHLKTAFVEACDQIDFDGIRDTERLLCRLRRIDGAELVAEFAWWREYYPGMVAGLVWAVDAREQAERRALVTYLRSQRKVA